MQVRILGPVEVLGESGVVPVPPRVLDVLAILACRPNSAVSTDELIDALWPGGPPRTSTKSLQVRVHELRRALGDSTLVGYRRQGYRLAMGAGELDAGQFEHLLGRGHAASVAGELDRAAELIRRALTLWRGPALAGQHNGDLVVQEAARLDELRCQATEELIDVELALGRHADIVGGLRRLVAEHPFREHLRAQLMLALYRLGRHADALAVYRETHRRMVEELGLEPGRELRDLHQAILRGDLGLAAAPPRSAPPTIVAAQLPLRLSTFVGRTGHLAELDAILAAREPSPVVAVIALAGMAGVGKTTLAVHWAHHVADRFPDGQLYVNLRSFDHSMPAMTPGEALRAFLEAFGVPPQRIPAGVPAQAGLYRSLLAGKRVLVVLDNAGDAEQVRPLLPGTSGCLALVTSRNELPGLVAAEGAHPISVDLLSALEAHQLLARRLGHARIAAEPDAVAEIITRCARLPLALTVVAARAATRPRFRLATLAADLSEADGRLDALNTGDPLSNVREVFSWSYRALNPPAARLFRLLGLHPGAEVGAVAAASLAGVPVPQARALLAELTRAHLLTEQAPDRYGFHDLLRAYASECVRAQDSDNRRRSAILRMLDHYLHTASTAAVLLDACRDPIALSPVHPGVVVVEPQDEDQAMDWFTTEHATLVAAVQLAVDARFDIHAWQLAWTLNTFSQRQGHWQAQATTQQAALVAARRLADQPGQASAHRGLARAYSSLGRHDDAHTHFRHALDLFHAVGNLTNEARVHLDLALTLDQQGHDREALQHAQRGLALYTAAGHRHGQARAMNTIGWFQAQLGQYQHALADCRRALTLLQELGDQASEAHVWDSLGYIHHQLGDFGQATTHYQRALDLLRQSGERYYHACTLIRLGDTHHADGNPGAALHAWQQGLDLLEQLGHPDAAKARAKLDLL